MKNEQNKRKIGVYYIRDGKKILIKQTLEKHRKEADYYNREEVLEQWLEAQEEKN